MWDACSDARVVFDSYDIQSEGGEQETTKSDKQDLSEDMVGSHHDRIDWSESDKRAIGYVIENRVVQRALIEALERFSNIQVGRGTRAKVVNKVEKVYFTMFTSSVIISTYTCTCTLCTM